MEKFRFTVKKIDGELTIGCFQWCIKHKLLFLKYNNAMNCLWKEKQKTADSLLSLLNEDPEFIPALNGMGKFYYKIKNYEEALNFYRISYELTHCKISNDFDGFIFWSVSFNRHYLNALKGLGLCYYKLLNYPSALKAFENCLL